MRRLISLRFVVSLAVSLGLLGHGAEGQTASAVIRGTVRDASGQALPGMTVTAAGRSAITDAAGAFRLEVEAGEGEAIEVRAYAPEDSTAEATRTVHVAPGETITIDLMLAPYREGAAVERAPEIRIEAAPTLPEIEGFPPPPPPPPSPSPPAAGTPAPAEAMGMPGEHAPEPLPEPAAKPALDKAVVRIFYATDRRPAWLRTTNGFYTGKRRSDDAVDVGVCDVSIPINHRLGELERPSVLRFEFNERRGRDVVLLSVTPVPEASFYAALHDRTQADPSRQLLIFVHGFNVGFADAARRTAQLAYDLDFPGAPVLYSWPSKGSARAYTEDEAAVDESRWHFQAFLEKLAARSGATRVFVIAHSMGSRVMARAVESLVGRHSLQPLPAFREIVLAAPDIDSGELRQLAASLHASAGRVTLYVNSKDLAIAASRKLHGASRAGDGSGEIFLADGIDTVDATDTDTSFLQHSYYAGAVLLGDIHALLMSDASPPRPGMEPAQRGSRSFWRLHARPP